MPELVHDVRAALHAAGYDTLMLRPDSAVLYFEDDSIMGHVHVVESAEEILDRWESIQDEFLRSNAPRFLRDPLKAWNIYTVLVTAAPHTQRTATALLSVEDDMRGTRKIVRAGVVTKQDVLGALAPILPLRNVSTVSPVNLTTRLEERLRAIATPLPYLVTGAATDAIAHFLLRDK